MPPRRIAIVGAGPAGLAAARMLHDAGHTPVVFEKSRGIGGRMATRRRDDAQFDHGAPGIEAATKAAQGWLGQAQHAGKALPWSAGAKPGSHLPYVGAPGMSALCRPLAEGLDIRFSSEVTSAVRDGGVWHLQIPDGTVQFDALIVAIPAPQVLRMLGQVQGVRDALQNVVMAPCWTLMVQFKTALDAPEDQTEPGGPFTRILCDSAKPGRDTNNCWVAHTNANWTRAHLEEERDTIRDQLLASLTKRLWPLPEVTVAMAHRWRFALTERALGQDMVALPDMDLFIGGDWTQGALAEDGFLSGQAMARTLLDRDGRA